MDGETEVVAVDTTWGKVQPLELASGVRTVGELELLELVDSGAILFCNGPQCPQSPDAIHQLLADGHPAASLAYYRGGLHDWVTLAMPTAPVG